MNYEIEMEEVEEVVTEAVNKKPTKNENVTKLLGVNVKNLKGLSKDSIISLFTCGAMPLNPHRNQG